MARSKSGTRSNDFLLGQLQAMAQENQQFQVEAMSELKEIRVAFTAHAQEDSDRFGEINKTISEAKGRVKGAMAVIGSLAAMISFLVGIAGARLSKMLGW